MSEPKYTEQSFDELSAQLIQMRLELTHLSEKIHQIVDSDKEYDTASAKASRDHTIDGIKEGIESVEPKIEDFHKTLEAALHQQPLTAISIAAGIGFLAGLIARR